ncbi:plant UBX domain-containing protein 1-like [Apium graveolens]|uniref:plant UBX domain-containing protein 1-like n=1 Tax=Apium graveolens TaxID=4045 RepID=UPI003D7B1EB3
MMALSSRLPLPQGPVQAKLCLSNLTSGSLLILTAMLDADKQRLGRDIRVFKTSFISDTLIHASNNDEDDDMYEFTPGDCYLVLGPNKQDVISISDN